MPEHRFKRLRDCVDIDAVLRIEQRCYQKPWSRTHFLQEFDNPVSNVTGVLLEGILAGYICYWLIAGEMQILNVAVDPDYRRRGLAALLLQKALADAGQIGLSSAWLEVRSGNIAAKTLYEHFGFEVKGCRKNYYQDGEDALLMLIDVQNSKSTERVDEKS